MADDNKPKDNWDKFQIFCEAVGKLLIPAIVAVIFYVWNSDRTEQQTTAAMTQIALGILSADPEEDETPYALIDWAVAVLESPADPPALTTQAAEELRLNGLPARGWADFYLSSGLSGGDGFGAYAAGWGRIGLGPNTNPVLLSDAIEFIDWEAVPPEVMEELSRLDPQLQHHRIVQLWLEQAADPQTELFPSPQSEPGGANGEVSDDP